MQVNGAAHRLSLPKKLEVQGDYYILPKQLKHHLARHPRGSYSQNNKYWLLWNHNNPRVLGLKLWIFVAAPWKWFHWIWTGKLNRRACPFIHKLDPKWFQWSYGWSFWEPIKTCIALLVVPYTGRKNINTYRISRDSGDLEVPYAGPEDHNKIWVIIRFLNIKIWFMVWILFFPN